MSKQAISVTLNRDNLRWLRGRSQVLGVRSVSALLDQLITDIRTGGSPGKAASRTVVGTVQICPQDPDLAQADDAIRTLFQPQQRASRRSRQRPHG